MAPGHWVVCVSDGCYGGHSVGETPGPIPNPEAKAHCADGTALVRVWESRSPPDLTYEVGLRLQPVVVGASPALTGRQLAGAWLGGVVCGGPDGPPFLVKDQVRQQRHVYLQMRRLSPSFSWFSTTD